MMARWIPLASSLTFSVSGKDSRRYLHNRLSQDIKSLTVGAAVQAAALSAQGRVEGFFSVCCLAEDRFLLISDGGDAAALKAIIAKYIVADRVKVEELSPAPRLIHVAADATTVAALHISEPSIICSISRRRAAASGVDLVVRHEAIEEVFSACQKLLGDPLSELEYYRQRWEQGVAVFPDELNDQVILTECGMKEAVSFSKGCYVGQEVIERSDAIGKLPRALERIRFNGHGVFPHGSPVLNGEGASIGKISSSMISGDTGEVYAFALLRTGTYSAGVGVTCMGVVGEVLSD
jgi:folate-binding protein YgfZ